jgi:FkbM family methyltransferase
MRTAGLIVLSIAIGAAAAVVAIRGSRNPESFLYGLRARAGVAPQNTSELDWLQRHYGPDRQSMNAEEWIVRDFFKDKREGTFVDVGAADYKVNSNTYFLEKQLGWSGIAIDAQASYRTDYEKFRPRTRFFALFVSDHSHDTARLFLGRAPGVSSSQADWAAQYGGVKTSAELPTVTLNDLLPAQGIETFDFLSMDIELAEPQALAGMDVRRFHPALAVIEAHPEVRQQILNYFTERGYAVVGKYLRVDRENLWFMPLGSTLAPFPPELESEEWQK